MTTNAFRMPSVGSYGGYSGNNYGVHTLWIDFGPVTVWFSYTTVVAFHVIGHQRVVHTNDWSRTTGKHLSWIDNKSKETRVPHDKFMELWSEQVAPYFDEDTLYAQADRAVGYDPPRDDDNGKLERPKRKILPLPVLKLS